MAKPVIVPLPAFAVYAKRPSWPTISQQGARCADAASGPVSVDALTTLSSPARETRYEDAAFEPASETMSWPRGVKSKPKGTFPADVVTVRLPSEPSWFTAYVSSVLDVRSATASTPPFSLKRTTAAPVAPLDSVRVHAATGSSSPRRPMRKPASVLLAVLSAYTTRFVAARLTGRRPPDGVFPIFSSPLLSTAKLVIVLLPAFTAYRNSWFGVSTRAY